MPEDPCLAGCGAPPGDVREVEGGYKGDYCLERNPEREAEAAKGWAGWSDPALPWADLCAQIYDHDPAECSYYQHWKNRSLRSIRPPQPSEHVDFLKRGRLAPALPDDRDAKIIGDVRLTIVGPEPSAAQLLRAAWIVQCAYAEMRFKTRDQPFSQPPEIRQQRRSHAVLGHVGDRLAGVVVLSSQKQNVYRARWLGNSRCARLEARLGSDQGWCTVDLVWVHPSYRRGRSDGPNLHLGMIMLKYAAEVTPAGSVENFAFAAPFSEGGRKLIDEYAPAGASFYALLGSDHTFEPCTHEEHSGA